MGQVCAEVNGMLPGSAADLQHLRAILTRLLEDVKDGFLVALAGFAKGEFHWMILSGNWGWSPALVAGLDPES
jgi:hypothetical protein